MGYRIGIDAGSKTIKVVIIDDDGRIVHSIYEKHRAAIKDTLVDVLHRIVWCYGDFVGPVAITGSAGMGVAQVLGLPFVQEVVATTKAIQESFPDADAAIELGGEDAKVIYLSGGLEQRMNATCAGGTGGFIDNIAFMLGTRSEMMNSLALSATRVYPIASRCAVFAQTDVRPLLNAGAKKSDIAASALDAVVRQTLGGLSCGRPIQGKVIFLGGPLEHIPDLVNRFKKALGLKRGMGIKPEDAHLFTARGTAIVAGEKNAPELSLKVLERRVAASPDPEDDLDHLPPLFASEADRIEFNRRHGHQTMARRSIYEYEGNAFLGLDAGSTTVKMALIAEDGSLLYSDYQPVQGDSLAVASLMLGNMYRTLPKHYASKEPYIKIAHASVTGYGEDLLKAALKVDSGVVETMAHMKAALAFDPQASFVLDIGGQDMKAMWLEDGQITDIMLNEACSSGCGSFIEGTAYSLQTRPHPFNRAALDATNPIDLGTKCTVFMTSRVRHAQKIGASLGDIAAGIAYSVVQNALFRIIGRDKVESMGDHIVVQGGAFKSDAVLRAFEKISDVEVIRPDTAHIMGAIGAALVARERALGIAAQSGQMPVSGIVPEEERKALSYEQTAATCPGCSNVCRLTVMTFSDGRSFIGGNRCPRAHEHVLGQPSDSSATAPNAVKAQQALLERYQNKESQSKLGTIKLGLMNILQSYEQLPFWHTFLSELGFSVAVPDRVEAEALRVKAAESIPSESVCQAAKLSHQRMYQLLGQDVDAVFMPCLERMGQCAVSCGYASALEDGAHAVVGEKLVMCSPVLSGQLASEITACQQDKDALLNALASLCDEDQQVCLRQGFDAAVLAALEEQRSFEAKVAKAAQHCLDWIAQDEERYGVIMAGRPYHTDADLLHGIDDVAATLGLAVLPAIGVGLGQLNAPSGKTSNWIHAARLEHLAGLVEQDPKLELVCLQAFGCGYDAVNLSLVRSQLLDAGKTFTSLKLDDIVDVAHIRIRLRTLAETLESRRMAKLRREEAARLEALNPKMVLPPEYQSWTDKPGLGGGISLNSPQMKRRQKVDVNGDEPQVILPGFLDGAGLVSRSSQLITIPKAEDWGLNDNREAALMAHRALSALKPIDAPAANPLPPGVKSRGVSRVDVLQEPLNRDDFEMARDKMPADVCPVASVLAARYVNLAADSRFLNELVVPKVCQACLLESVPVLLEQAMEKRVRIVWKDPVDSALCEGVATEELGPLQPGDPLRIGILGNPLLCFDPLMNDGIAELLEELGCQPVFPRPELISTDDVRYEEQLEAFQRQHVEHVIYLQSFGCLKGHVQARGALRSLSKKFPELPITVIDFDPEASVLNRENRLRLAVEAARALRPDAALPPRKTNQKYAWLGSLENRVEKGARLLAMGEDPLGDDSSVALAYVLEEGELKGMTLAGPAQAARLLEKGRAEAEERLKEQQRMLDIINNALDCLE